MLKKITAAALLCAGTAGFAGFIDFGDRTGAPRVFARGIKTAIARKYFPEINSLLPPGLPRRDAWIQDIKKAANGLNIAPAELEKFTKYVLAPGTNSVVSAPHEKLQEFELYARGWTELTMKEHKDLPASWQKLFAMPLEKRLFTTIPVLRGFCRYRQFNTDIPNKKNEKILVQMIESKKQGCYDTQGCILDFINDTCRDPNFMNDLTYAHKTLLRKQFVNDYSLPEIKNMTLKEFRENYLKSMFNAETADQDLFWALYTGKEETLRKMCQEEPALRDYIVCLAFTNRNMPQARKVALEFYRQSVINYPLSAINIPLEDAVNLLNNHPEHHALRDLLILKSLNGYEKIRAIEKYIAKYPDYAGEENMDSFVILNTHADLYGMAGAELFKLGKPMEAAKYWINGCAPEDMGMVAEQIMTIAELKQFCDEHCPQPVLTEQNIYSANCMNENDFQSGRAVDTINKKQVSFMLRNLLARRLMRAGNFAEARKYFNGNVTRFYSEKFFKLQEIIDSKNTSESDKINAMLNMAALIRFHGDKLFGTFLEPDNLISKNRYPCIWGTKQQYVKLTKPDLPRYSYRYRAADLYAKVAEMTRDRTLKAKVILTAGTLLKNRAPAKSDVYFKKLFAIAPELTEKNWFKVLKKTPSEIQEFYKRKYFIQGSIADHTPPEPEIEAVKLPVDSKDKNALLKFGMEICRKSPYAKPDELSQAQYALKLAGDMGLTKADIWSAILQYLCYENYENALYFLRLAEKRGDTSNLLKHELGHVYSELGYWQEAITLIQQAADNEKDDLTLLGLAAFNTARFYFEGRLGITPDAQKGKHYLEIARKAGNWDAANYQWPPKKQPSFEDILQKIIHEQVTENKGE